MKHENAVINAINEISEILRDVVLYINSSYAEHVLTLDSICIYLENSCPNFEDRCKKLDNCFKLMLLDDCDVDKDKILKGIKSSFSQTSFDSMGYLCCMYPLESTILNRHSQFDLYEGVYFSVNINNYSVSEQLVLGTCCL